PGCASAATWTGSGLRRGHLRSSGKRSSTRHPWKLARFGAMSKRTRLFGPAAPCDLIWPAGASQAQANSAACKNHLHQMGLALKMHVTDYGVYPYYLRISQTSSVFWMQSLESYYR